MEQHIEDLIAHEINQNVIKKRDYVYVKNQLYHLLNLTVKEIQLKPREIKMPSDALNPLLDLLQANGTVEKTVVARDLFDSKIMNIFASLPSTIESRFNRLKYPSSAKATTWLYRYASSLNYIRHDRIAKNISFEAPSLYGTLQITINLSKPEKDPRSIILQGSQKSTAYPKCVLCAENEGFPGNYSRDSRDQHRLIGVNLNKETWFFQYSPYSYYNEHAIVLSKDHRPMVINDKTFKNLLDLTDTFDDYFFGSNADLPIVGGSILSHDHYQGGKHVFPIQNAKISKTWHLDDMTIESLIWPLSTIRLISKDKNTLVKQATRLLSYWIGYQNEALDIMAYTDNTRHNTITPIARKHQDTYELDLILRNNRTTDAYPLGIFHPHEDRWHIKKENIGLIEAAGLAVLPARLLKELADLKQYILNGTPLSEDGLKHKAWLDTVLKKHKAITATTIDDILNHEVGNVFEAVLKDCGVFKKDELLNQFIEGMLNENLFTTTI